MIERHVVDLAYTDTMNIHERCRSCFHIHYNDEVKIYPTSLLFTSDNDVRTL